MYKVVLFILLSLSLSAQESENYIDTVFSKRLHFSKSDFPSDERSIKEYLETKIDNLSSQNSNLVLLYYKESKAGKHYCYTQQIFNIPVYRSMVKVNILNNTSSVDVISLTFSENDINLPVPKCDFLFPQENNLIPANRKIENHFFVFENLNGQKIYTFDQHSYSGKTDTTAVVTVFNPDPLTSAQVNYGAPYYDNNNSTNSSLDAQLQFKTVALKFQNDTFYLENQYYQMKDFDAPNKTVTTSVKDTFQFNRSQDGFEDINCFYHLTVCKDYLANIGYPSLVNNYLNIDAHAWSGAENSSFDEYTIPATLLFGEGGIDDAEDADVVVHEFGHFISANAAPFSNAGLQRKSIDEGFGDYLASSYSRSISEYNWSKVFNWDGNNGSWQGRNSASTKQYPDDYTGNQWKDGEIWSSVLMEINTDLGRNITDQLVFEALFMQSTNTFMADAAINLLKADTALFNAKYHCEIYKRLSERGLLSPSSCSVNELTINGSYNFMQGGTLSILFPSYSSGNIYLYDINGKQIDQCTFNNQKSIGYSLDKLAAGLYIIDIQTETESKQLKLLRY